MADWHISLHFLGLGDVAVEPILYQNTQIETLKISSSNLQAPFPIRFDRFIDSINELETGYAEGDGSFGLVGPNGVWKINGTIYERHDAIQYVEMMGYCPKPSFEQLVLLLGVSMNGCAIQNMRGGFFQTFEQFFRN